MSIGNRHSLTLFVSGTSQALAGQRLAKIGYKSTKANPAKFPSVCASIPPLENLPENLEDFKVHILAWFMEKQDSVIRGLYEASNGTRQSVGDDEIGYSAILGYLNAESVSGRLTKDAIEQWFKLECEGVVLYTAAVKKGFCTPEDSEPNFSEGQMKELQKTCNAYRDLFSGLAGGATRYAENVQDSLLRILSVCPESTLTEKLTARIEGMKEQKDFAELL